MDKLVERTHIVGRRRNRTGSEPVCAQVMLPERIMVQQSSCPAQYSKAPDLAMPYALIRELEDIGFKLSLASGR